jgi:hypothetical protein
MRYANITQVDRFQLPASHPHLAMITIDPADWHRFQQLGEDNPAVLILGHNDPADGHMIVYTACASQETLRRLEDGWG